VDGRGSHGGGIAEEREVDVCIRRGAGLSHREGVIVNEGVIRVTPFDIDEGATSPRERLGRGVPDVAGDLPLLSRFAVQSLPIAGDVPAAVVRAAEPGRLGSVAGDGGGAILAELLPAAENDPSRSVQLETRIGENTLTACAFRARQPEREEQRRTERRT